MNQSQCQSQVGFGTFGAIVREIEAKIEINCFPAGSVGQAREICMIIAEVFLLPEASEVKIAGEKLPVELVRSIFSQIEHEDVAGVIAGIEKATYEIKHKKAYLRTALYNSVFERETKTANDIRVMDGGRFLTPRKVW